MNLLCSLCKESKDSSEFAPSSQNSIRKKTSWCRMCIRKRAMLWYNKNKIRVHGRETVRRRKYKLAALEAYGGAICSCCGETIVQFLVLDHKDNNGTEHRRTNNRHKGSSFYVVLKNEGYPKEYNLQVLCANCNWGKFAGGGVCPHKDENKTINAPSHENIGIASQLIYT